MSDVERMLQVAATFARDGDFAGVESAADAATRLDPSCFDGWVLLASARAKQNEHQSALLAFEQALRLQPDAIAVWVDVAESHIAMLNHAQAAAALKRAMELDPNGEHPAGRRARAITGRILMSNG